jgi:hypothetical protein
MPLTIYNKEYQSLLKIEDMDMRADVATEYPGRGYRYYAGEPLFEAFEGLSLTSFSTSCTNSSWNEGHATAVVVSCSVENTGIRDGDAVVLLFHRPPQAPAGQRQRPIRRLLDFDRVTVPAGGKADVHKFVIEDLDRELMLTSENGTLVEVPGVHVLEIQDGPSFHVPV